MRGLIFTIAIVLGAAHVPSAQKGTTATPPTFVLRAAETMRLPGGVDSNSPVVWDRRDGRTEMFVVTSIDGRPSRARGGYLTMLDAPRPVDIDPWPVGGVWMEAIVKDVETWYGFYHNENDALVCPGKGRQFPRIGAARSTDFGETWTDLGIILDMPVESFACHSTNRYFVGGFGDFSVKLDWSKRYLYLYFSQYGRDPSQQGVGVARLAWANRDAPVGKLMVWSDRLWLPASRVDDEHGERWVYPRATPLVIPGRPWHDADRVVDAFWGPSIHWNAYLEQYVMLLNRARDETFAQEGIYVSFNRRLGDVAAWTYPQKILDGGRWYPQVVGIEVGKGTDAWAGRVARFFMAGRSDHVLEFTR